jgi:acylphosphatase
MTALHAVVRGMVQGVGFRYSALYRAQALGLSGWVKNRFDGSVETRAVGEESAVQEYLDWLRQGPPNAEVEAVETVYHGITRDADAGLAGGGFTVTF